MDASSRRTVLKWLGAGAIAAGAAYTGLTLFGDTPLDGGAPAINGSDVGFSWDQTFTDTSWVGAAGDALSLERVTSLEPTGPGSISDAFANAAGRPTVIVFEVGGVIDLGSSEDLQLHSSETWIAGETAPSPGIAVTKGSFRVHAPRCIVSHISVLPGDETPDASDGIVIEADDVLFDHCTGMWGTDEVAAVVNPVDRGSFINCIVAEGLYDSIHPEGLHSRGMLFNEAGTDMCVMGCLFAHNNRRHPLSRADIVLANNYIYNFGGSDGTIITFDGPETPNVTAQGLHVDPGADSSSSREVFSYSATLYHDDIQTAPVSRPVTDGSQTIVDTPPILPPGLELETDVVPANDVRRFVTDIAGPRPADRPPLEADLIERRLNGSHGFVNSQDQVGGYPSYAPTSRPLDVEESRLVDRLRQQRRAVEQGTTQPA